MKFSRSDFEMQRFESRRPRLRVLANFDSKMQRFESRRPNQSVRLKRIKYEGRSKTARRRYELVSVCGIWQWRRHSCLLSQRAFFGVSYLLCVPHLRRPVAVAVVALLISLRDWL